MRVDVMAFLQAIRDAYLERRLNRRFFFSVIGGGLPVKFL